MELTELQKHWNAFGEQDQLWSILSLPGKRFGKWDVEEFFQLGWIQVDELMKCVVDRGIAVRRGMALDFGCGVGRLTQALCDKFDHCVGVDIAPSMIESARRHNRHGERCEYLLNPRDDLSVFPDDTFDFLLSIIVLQHMRPEYAKRYIGEFLRIVAPGGLVIFHLPGGHAPRQNPVKVRETAASAPLEEQSFRAVLKLVEVPATMVAGARADVRVRVENRSPRPWPALGGVDHRFQVRLGNHWLDASGRLAVRDDGRVSLHRDLPPGEADEFHLEITAPQVPGEYTLELDLVQEHVTWFKDRGSATASAAVDVVSDAERPIDDFKPEAQMYSIPREEVVALIEDRGGRVLDVQRVNVDGPLLEYNYYVTK